MNRLTLMRRLTHKNSKESTISRFHKKKAFNNRFHHSVWRMVHSSISRKCPQLIAWLTVWTNSCTSLIIWESIQMILSDRYQSSTICQPPNKGNQWITQMMIILLLEPLRKTWILLISSLEKCRGLDHPEESQLDKIPRKILGVDWQIQGGHLVNPSQLMKIIQCPKITIAPRYLENLTSWHQNCILQLQMLGYPDKTRLLLPLMSIWDTAQALEMSQQATWVHLGSREEAFPLEVAASDNRSWKLICMFGKVPARTWDTLSSRGRAPLLNVITIAWICPK